MCLFMNAFCADFILLAREMKIHCAMFGIPALNKNIE